MVDSFVKCHMERQCGRVGPYYDTDTLSRSLGPVYRPPWLAPATREINSTTAVLLIFPALSVGRFDAPLRSCAMPVLRGCELMLRSKPSPTKPPTAAFFTRVPMSPSPVMPPITAQPPPERMSYRP